MNPDQLNRTTKILIDSGATLAEAEYRIATARLHICVEPELLNNPAGQAGVATIIITGARAFKGGVTIEGLTDLEQINGPGATALPALRAMVTITDSPAPDSTTIALGDVRAPESAIRTSADGWTVTVGPDPLPWSPSAWPVAAVAAGALAVAEALQQLVGHPTAGRRTLRRSLWNLDNPDVPALGPEADLRLPDDWWLMGLGHLGQGVVWSILHLGHPNPGLLQLQDTQTITGSNHSTGALIDKSSVGTLKTRWIATAVERLSWRTTLLERRFDNTYRMTAGDPALVISGFDNNRARRHLADLDADTIIDLGLGSTPSSYDGIAMRSFPGGRTPREIRSWQQEPEPRAPDQVAYRDAVRSGLLDDCGVITVGQIAVGAACVGAFAGALAVAEAVRRASQAHGFDHVDLQLRSTGPAVARLAGRRAARFRTTPMP